MAHGICNLLMGFLSNGAIFNTQLVFINGCWSVQWGKIMIIVPNGVRTHRGALFLKYLYSFAS